MWGAWLMWDACLISIWMYNGEVTLFLGIITNTLLYPLYITNIDCISLFNITINIYSPKNSKFPLCHHISTSAWCLSEIDHHSKKFEFVSTYILLFYLSVHIFYYFICKFMYSILLFYLSVYISFWTKEHAIFV